MRVCKIISSYGIAPINAPKLAYAEDQDDLSQQKLPMPSPSTFIADDCAFALCPHDDAVARILQTVWVRSQRDNLSLKQRACTQVYIGIARQPMFWNELFKGDFWRCTQPQEKRVSRNLAHWEQSGFVQSLAFMSRGLVCEFA